MSLRWLAIGRCENSRISIPALIRSRYDVIQYSEPTHDLRKLGANFFHPSELAMMSLLQLFGNLCSQWVPYAS